MGGRCTRVVNHRKLTRQTVKRAPGKVTNETVKWRVANVNVIIEFIDLNKNDVLLSLDFFGWYYNLRIQEHFFNHAHYFVQKKPSKPFSIETETETVSEKRKNYENVSFLETVSVSTSFSAQMLFLVLVLETETMLSLPLAPAMIPLPSKLALPRIHSQQMAAAAVTQEALENRWKTHHKRVADPHPHEFGDGWRNGCCCFALQKTRRVGCW